MTLEQNYIDTDQLSISSIETVTVAEIRVATNKSWISQHFILEKRADEEEARRYCLATNCDKSYQKDISHALMKRHWREVHDDYGSKKTVFLFHDKLHIDRLIKHVIVSGKEFSLVDDESFREFCRVLCPSKSIISRKSTSEIIRAKFPCVRSMVIEELADEPSLSLTFDIWSSKNKSMSFACITGHFIDSSWTMRSFLLEFDRLPYPHDSNSISNFMKQALSHFKIASKISAITCDNASNNRSH